MRTPFQLPIGESISNPLMRGAVTPRRHHRYRQCCSIPGLDASSYKANGHILFSDFFTFFLSQAVHFTLSSNRSEVLKSVDSPNISSWIIVIIFIYLYFSPTSTKPMGLEMEV